MEEDLRVFYLVNLQRKENLDASPLLFPMWRNRYYRILLVRPSIDSITSRLSDGESSVPSFLRRSEIEGLHRRSHAADVRLEEEALIQKRWEAGE